jgi:hypothetical protein
MSSSFTKATVRLLFAATLAAVLMIFATIAASAQQTSTTQTTTAPPTPNTTQQPTNTQDASRANAAATLTNSNAATTPPAPVYKDYKGVSIGMSAQEVRDKLGHLRSKSKTEDDFDFSNGESAQVYYDSEGKVRAISVTYFGKKSNAPTPQAVLGEELPAKPNSSMYKLVRYPQAGYWVAYSRTAGDSPLVTVTIQKMSRTVCVCAASGRGERRSVMDEREITVLVGGVASILFVLWYFFGEREATAAREDEAGVQEIEVTVKGGYSPDVIAVKQGAPVRLNFYRDETASCSEQIVFGDFGIARDLPAFKTTPIEFTPDRAG